MLKELQKELGGITAEMEKCLKSGTNEDITRFDELKLKAEEIEAKIERVKQFEGVKSYADKSAGMISLADGTKVGVDFNKDGETHVENKDGNLLVSDTGEPIMEPATIKAIRSPEYKSAYMSYLRMGINGISAAAIKTLQEGADPSGGYLVPEEILNKVIAREPAPTTVQSKVTRVPSSRDTLVMPKVVYATDNLYTSGMRVTWTGELPATATAHRVTEPVFGELRIPIFTAMMSLPLSNNLVDDASFPVMSWSSSKFNETIELLYENMIINGSGVNQPRGILLNPDGTDEPATVVSGSAAALTADGIVDLGFALPEQYDRNAAFVMNKTNVARNIAKIKDGDGRYMWGAGTQDSGLSVPAVRGRDLLGYPVLYNAFMPNIAANAYPIIFGDLSGYYLAIRAGFSIQVLRETYAEQNIVVLLGKVRFGGVVAEPFRLRIQQCHV